MPKTWKPDPKQLPEVASKVRVTCNRCGMTTVKMEYNVSLFTRGHQKGSHPGEPMDFEYMTIVPSVPDDAPEWARRAEAMETEGR